jgi:hypothetical protein
MRWLMADGTALTPAPATSLQGDAAAARTQIDAWRADRGSPYYRGGDGFSAAWIQQHDRDLTRGELAGAAGAIGPDFEADRDMPLHVGAYDIASAPGAHSMQAEDRAWVDAFLPIAFAGGLGNRKTKEAIGWCLTVPNLTVEMFRDLAAASGWSDGHIATCVDWYKSLAAQASGRTSDGRFASKPAAPTFSDRAARAARIAELEASMYDERGQPNPLYWSGGGAEELRRLIAEQGA